MLAGIINQVGTKRRVMIEIPRLHAAQAEIKRGRKRFNVVDCGRRFGKDILDRDLALGVLQKRQPVGWFEPTYKSLAENWRNLRGILAPIILDANASEHRMVICGGGVLEMWSLDNLDAGRGRKYAGVIINEAAQAPDLEYSWQKAIRATLFDLAGWAVFSGTPRGMTYFHTLYETHEIDSDWASWCYPTMANPTIPRQEIETARRELPEPVFRQEVLAEFLADGAYFQGLGVINRIKQPEPIGIHDDHYVVGGLDWALSNDFTVLTLGCRDCNTVIYWDRFNQIDMTYQRERIVSACEKYHVKGLLPERNSIGEPNIELLRDRVRILRGPDGRPGFNTTATSKPPLIQNLASALEHEGFQVPDDYMDELRTYEVTMGKGGHPIFGAGSGRHDDRVISLALCWNAMSSIPSIKLIDFV